MKVNLKKRENFNVNDLIIIVVHVIFDVIKNVMINFENFINVDFENVIDVNENVLKNVIDMFLLRCLCR